jgi:hypothetical protein
MYLYIISVVFLYLLNNALLMYDLNNVFFFYYFLITKYNALLFLFL